MADLLISRLNRAQFGIAALSEKGSLWLLDQMHPPYVINAEHVEDFALTVQKEFELKVELK